MNLWVADPAWGWWVIAYFFLGGIAAGCYFIAILIEWFGVEEDRDLVRIAYWLAFPLTVVCGVLLIADLDRPERFWHMLFRSEGMKAAVDAGFPWTGRGWGEAAGSLNLKYWSPMSAGSWMLVVFGLCTFLSFLSALGPKRWPGRWLRTRWVRRGINLVGCIAGFFIATYTGGLLSATNQPMWSDTTWLGALFLASSASTALATMSLIARWKNLGTPEARDRLESAELPALGLELVVLGAFLASLGDALGPVLLTVRGNLLVFGTLVVAVLIPLLLHVRVARRRPWAVPAGAVCVLVGGLLLRWATVTTPGELLARGPSALVSFAPEQHRRAGQPGADVGNRGPAFVPRSKESGQP